MGEDASFGERRAAVRHTVWIPVWFDKGAGVIHNVSTLGALFETVSSLEPGERVSLSFTLPGEGGDGITVGGEGVVVRVEPALTGFRVAAHVEEFTVVRVTGVDEMGRSARGLTGEGQ